VRLEKEEEQGYRRLEAALANGNAVAIDAAQTYWLRIKIAFNVEEHRETAGAPTASGHAAHNEARLSAAGF
jgi:hypothetical protein